MIKTLGFLIQNIWIESGNIWNYRELLWFNLICSLSVEEYCQDPLLCTETKKVEHTHYSAHTLELSSSSSSKTASVRGHFGINNSIISFAKHLVGIL